MEAVVEGLFGPRKNVKILLIWRPFQRLFGWRSFKNYFGHGEMSKFHQIGRRFRGCLATQKTVKVSSIWRPSRRFFDCVPYPFTYLKVFPKLFCQPRTSRFSRHFRHANLLWPWNRRRWRFGNLDSNLSKIWDQRLVQTFFLLLQTERDTIATFFILLLKVIIFVYNIVQRTRLEKSQKFARNSQNQ